MRQAKKILATAAVIAATFGTSVSQAAFFSFPRMLAPQVERVSFDKFVLAPMEHVRFCLTYPTDCQPGKLDFRRRHIALTEERWHELNQVNREVNREIVPDPTLGPATMQWRISPLSGNCHDYAVTKRHELLALGWPSRSLLLAEVVVPSGEHHLVLVVRTKEADLVLDNLNANIRSAAMTRYQYQWVRVESPFNPRFWSSVTVPAPPRVAMIDAERIDN
jgi:predicted transglutaminase-like cysteine proteinase